MALNRGEVNPLSVLGMRQLSFIPEHFTRVTIKNAGTDIRMLDQWINHHLNSRYAVRKIFVIDDSNKMVEGLEIGLEDPIEISMLTLGCPHIYKK